MLNKENPQGEENKLSLEERIQQLNDKILEETKISPAEKSPSQQGYLRFLLGRQRNLRKELENKRMEESEKGLKRITKDFSKSGEIRQEEEIGKEEMAENLMNLNKTRPDGLFVERKERDKDGNKIKERGWDIVTDKERRFLPDKDQMMINTQFDLLKSNAKKKGEEDPLFLVLNNGRNYKVVSVEDLTRLNKEELDKMDSEKKLRMTG